MIMRHSFLYPLMLAIGVIMAGCSDELQVQKDNTDLVLDEGELSEVKLNLSVNPFTVDMHAWTRASDPSDTSETATEEEKAIHDIWVFQYDEGTKKLLIKPRYYTITDQATLTNLTVQLRTDVDGESIVYVVANTGDDDWANNGTDGSLQDFSTLDKLQKETLPNPRPIQFGKEGNDVSIPMGGSKTDRVEAGGSITVPVTRMYAKLKIKVNISVGEMELYDVNIRQIPWYCRIESLNGSVQEPTEAIPFPAKTQLVSRAFAASEQADDEDWMVIYIPETLQGEIADMNDKSEQPENALAIDVTTSYGGGRLVYTVYPGGNTTNNFNIQRNCVYRVNVNINTIVDSQHQPSANCFVVKPGDLLAFEPYYRVEQGGGFDISSYLNCEDENLEIKKLEIIWQTKNCIGNNEKGDLVYLEEGEPNLHQKIFVKTNKKGNALIAAYNKDNKIIWSWHIWVTDHEPDNLGKAIVYYTYDWDKDGIYPTKPRIQGYAVMSCNLGALADNPNEKDTQTFGMLYQWGRKDPFPPIRTIEFDGFAYTNDVTDAHYGNDNETLVHKTSGTDSGYLFHSVFGSKLEGAVEYSIANPTVFICGTNEICFEEKYLDNLANYFNEGDWCPKGESNDQLWGGLKPSMDSDMKYLEVSKNNNIHIFDNYGEKSIFDPCPKGWRVAPGELWLEFTSTGYNPISMDQINYNPSQTSGTYGMMMYMQDWREGPSSYFPMQGTRVGGGGGIRVGTCGNYHNATTDLNNRVNILHIHNDKDNFHVFEDAYPMYFVKSTAGPVRCVRDSK